MQKKVKISLPVVDGLEEDGGAGRESHATHVVPPVAIEVSCFLVGV